MSAPCREGLGRASLDPEPGLCPVCWREISLTARGLLYRHVFEPGVPCPASGRAPEQFPPHVVTVQPAGEFL